MTRYKHMNDPLKGIKRLDELAEGGPETDAEYLEIMREFCDLAARLPKGGRVGHKHVNRLLTIIAGKVGAE